jgi:hypothetical protein
MSRSTPVATAHTDTTEGAAQHAHENKYDQRHDEKEHQHYDKTRGGSEEIERGLEFRLGRSTGLLLNNIKKESPNLSALMQDGNAQRPEDCRHPAAEEPADGSHPRSSASVQRDFWVTPTVQRHRQESCTDESNR